MAELADALGSGPSGVLLPVEVQVLSWVLKSKDLRRSVVSPFLFAQRSWQTPSVLVTDLALFVGKRIRMARAALANGGV